MERGEQVLTSAALSRASSTIPLNMFFDSLAFCPTLMSCPKIDRWRATCSSDFLGHPRQQRWLCYADSPTTIKALHRYLTERKVLGGRNTISPLFATRVGRRFDRRYLAKHLGRLGRRAGIKSVHAHRFRHTFAINYLRNGGDVYTLQDLLGHTSLDMVRRYLHLAQVDIDTAHRRASPVENWRL